jgi:hypothetical protein
MMGIVGVDMKIKINRRTVISLGVTYPNYEMDFYTSNVYSKCFKDKDRALKPIIKRGGYPSFNFRHMGKSYTTRQHKLLAETFPDLLLKSPLVSHYGLQIGKDQHELKTPMGFTFICNMVCPDHIDNNKANNSYKNLMITTQSENILKCDPFEGRKYKGIHKTLYGKYRVSISWQNILYENGKHFRTSKNFETEEEAVLAYNTVLKESLLTVWGSDLGPKMYDLAYKNTI